MKFKDMKFKIKNPEHSKKIQKELFKQGYKWGDGLTLFQYMKNKYLYTYLDGFIAFSDDTELFKKDTNKKTKLKELKAIRKEKVVDKEPVAEKLIEKYIDTEIKIIDVEKED